MSDEGLVDILLVRLGRDEEKERVRKLLVKELGFSDEEARQAVAETPNMIKKAVPMGKGRVIQNRLYPYIDLLPRMDLVDEEPDEEEAETPPPAEPAGRKEAQPPSEEPAAGPDEPQSEEGEEPALETAAAAVMPSGDGEPAGPEDDEPEEEPVGEEEEREEKTGDGVVVTSAAEEMRQVERCHICGRTPTDGEKLAPCRSCGDLTCRDCFDRVAHVCKKCAADGKFVDKPPQRTRETAPDSTPARRQASRPAVSSGGGGPSRGLVVGVIAAAVAVAVLAVGYFLDPLGLFASGGGEGGAAGQTEEQPADTVAAADTASVDTASVAADTLAADSTAADTAAVAEQPEPGPLNLAAATLDSASSEAEAADLRLVRSSGVSGLDVLAGDLEELAPALGRISSSVPIEIDAATLFRTRDGITVLAVAVLHPEEDTRRYEMLRRIAHYLAPTGIAEMVFYYRENRYYDARVVPYLNEDFESLQEATGPMEFQDLAGCTDAEQWELLNGRVKDWMTSFTP
jgi:hypothetical protein